MSAILSRTGFLTSVSVALALSIGAWCYAQAATGVPRAATDAPCARSGSATVLENREARVYATRRGGRIKYACLKDTGRREKLDGPISDIRTRPPPAMALAGPLLLTVTDTLADGLDVAADRRTLGIIDLRVDADGRSPVVTTRLGYGVLGVGSAQLKENGSFAFVSCLTSGRRGIVSENCLRRETVSPYEVVKYEVRAPRRRVVLESGLQIDPASLRLRGSRLTWRSGSETKSAPLR